MIPVSKDPNCLYFVELSVIREHGMSYWPPAVLEDFTRDPKHIGLITTENGPEARLEVMYRFTSVEARDRWLKAWGFESWRV